MARTLKTVLLLVALAAALAVLAEADCCKRKGNFGCCGNVSDKKYNVQNDACNATLFCVCCVYE